MSVCTNCENSQIKYAGDGSQVLFTFPFTYIDSGDVYVEFYNYNTRRWVDANDPIWLGAGEWTFANATTIEFTTAPEAPIDVDVEAHNIRITRCTDLDPLVATFYPGSAIRAQDLNENFEQLKAAIEEGRCSVPDWLFEYLDDFYWNSQEDTLKCGDDWVTDDKHIATTCANDARYWNKAEDSTFIMDPWEDEADDRHVPSTGAVDKFVKEQVQDLADNIADAIDKSLINSEDERQGRWNRMYNDDQHLITALAASQRFDVALSDRSPDRTVWIEPGKIWINSETQEMYYWNGSVWVQPKAGGGGGNGGIPEAPDDGQLYGRQDGAWEVVESFNTGNISVEPNTPLTRTVTGNNVSIGFDIAQLPSAPTTRLSFNS